MCNCNFLHDFREKNCNFLQPFSMVNCNFLQPFTRPICIFISYKAIFSASCVYFLWCNTVDSAGQGNAASTVAMVRLMANKENNVQKWGREPMFWTLFFKKYVYLQNKKKAMEKLIGRESEIYELQQAFNSAKSEFVVIYGRRRVGKGKHTSMIHSEVTGKDLFAV